VLRFSGAVEGGRALAENAVNCVAPDQGLITALPMEVTAVVTRNVGRLRTVVARTNWRGTEHDPLLEPCVNRITRVLRTSSYLRIGGSKCVSTSILQSLLPR
jgi:hypothetical protein